MASLRHRFPSTWRKQFLLLLRLIIGGILVFSGVAKVHGPFPYLKFVVTLGMGKSVAYLSLVAVTAAELSLGALALVGLHRRVVMRLIGLLFLSFVVVLSYALIRGVSGSCGCFGRLVAVKLGVGEVVRDLLLAAGAWYLGGRRDVGAARSRAEVGQVTRPH
ncbi:MAG: MauE/DoxX family redox-associated membrane protein [Candidatus Oleimicrobiaceae bacterium]